MRIMTVRQPHAWAIIHGGKDVENRVRNIAGNYRGLVAIHAGIQLDEDYNNRMIGHAVGMLARAGIRVGLRNVPSHISEPDERRFHVTERFGYRGAIIGVVNLNDVHHFGDCVELVDGAYRPCSPWAALSGHHLMLSEQLPLATPIPYRGALGLRTLPDRKSVV